MSTAYIEKPGVLTQAQAMPFIESYLPGLVADFFDGWEWVQNILDQDPERRATLDASMQAGMVFCRFIRLIGMRLSGDENIELRKHGRMLRALISKAVALRFKKLQLKRNGHLVAGNVKTNAQTLIYYQLGFDGMQSEHPTEVTFGYTTDKANRTVTGLYLTCPISWHSNKWTVPVLANDIEGQLPFAAPADPNRPPENQATFIITPKEKSKVAES